VDEVDGDAEEPTATVWRSTAVDRSWSDLVAAMERAAVVDEPMQRRIAAELGREHANVVVDIGCGVGSMTVALAESLPDARLVAADLTRPCGRRLDVVWPNMTSSIVWT